MKSLRWNVSRTICSERGLLIEENRLSTESNWSKYKCYFIVRFQELEAERWLETMHENRTIIPRERFPYVYDALTESEHIFITVNGSKVCFWIFLQNDLQGD